MLVCGVVTVCCSGVLHLALFAPLERARFDANAGRSLARAARRRQNVVGAPDQLSGRVEAVADHAHRRIGGYAAALGRFAGEWNTRGRWLVIGSGFNWFRSRRCLRRCLRLFAGVAQYDAHVRVAREMVHLELLLVGGGQRGRRGDAVLELQRRMVGAR